MKLSKYAVLLYGTSIYVFFLATYVYCIGFVTGLLVPRHLDSLDGAAPSTLHALLINGGLLGLFAVQHTIMARDWFKTWITKWIPAAAERSTFVLATCSILCATYLYWQPMPTIVWEFSNPTLRGVLHAISVGGFLGVVFTTFIIDHFDLFGIKPVILNFLGKKPVAANFQVQSLYRFSRHPMYFCLLFAFWSAPTMTVGRLVFALLCTGYIFIGVRFEEHSLTKVHGDDYRNYKRDLPMIIPSFGKSIPSVAPKTSRLPNA